MFVNRSDRGIIRILDFLKDLSTTQNNISKISKNNKKFIEIGLDILEFLKDVVDTNVNKFIKIKF